MQHVCTKLIIMKVIKLDLNTGDLFKTTTRHPKALLIGQLVLCFSNQWGKVSTLMQVLYEYKYK